MLLLILACGSAPERPAPAPPATDVASPWPAAPLAPVRVDALESGASFLTISLAELLPPLPPSAPTEPASTALTHPRRAPSGGVWEARGGVEVRTRCEERGCIDQPFDVDAGRALPVPPFGVGPEASLERVVRLDSVNGARVTAWIGGTAYTPGAAHAINDLGCASWSRDTGERLDLATVLGEAEARTRLAVTQAQLRARAGEALATADQAERLATLTPATTSLLARPDGQIWLCVAPPFSDSGSVLLFRLLPAAP